MSSLKWVQVDADFPASAAVGHVSRTLSLSRQQVVGLMVDVWLWAGANAPGGTIRSAHPAADIEEAAKWTGAAGELVRVLVDASLLAQTADGYRLTGWSRYEKLLAKRVRDAERKRLRDVESRGGSAEVARNSDGGSADAAATSAGGRADAARPSPSLSLLSSKGVQGETRPASHAAYEPSLFEALAAAFKTKRGADYGRSAWGDPMGADVAALKQLLALSKGDEAEIRRRWDVALDWVGFPECASLADLARFWNRYAAAKPAATSDVRRGVVRAEDARHVPVGEVKL